MASRAAKLITMGALAAGLWWVTQIGFGLGARSPSKVEKKNAHDQVSYVAHPFSCRSCHPKQHDFWASTAHASAYLVLFSKKQHFDPECVSCHTLGHQKARGFQKIVYPLALKKGEERAKGDPFIERLMKEVFGEELSKGPLDSRKQPQRHAKLHQRYLEKIHELEKQNKIKQNFLGVQCEHCHGNRHGHPISNKASVKKVPQATCKNCHHPPRDYDFNFAVDVKKVACPLMQRK